MGSQSKGKHSLLKCWPGCSKPILPDPFSPSYYKISAKQQVHATLQWQADGLFIELFGAMSPWIMDAKIQERAQPLADSAHGVCQKKLGGSLTPKRVLVCATCQETHQILTMLKSKKPHS